eukprot:GHVU01150041.1.p3 GENE.GHVU01150041.1~~GHVU01150041.1.p3  ORF type:complete len:122 (+),score=6.03 GHVU01150041.1:525-890(+)
MGGSELDGRTLVITHHNRPYVLTTQTPQSHTRKPMHACMRAHAHSLTHAGRQTDAHALDTRGSTHALVHSLTHIVLDDEVSLGRYEFLVGADVGVGHLVVPAQLDPTRLQLVREPLVAAEL